MTGWKTIDSAPKDGRTCLIWRHGWSKPETLVFSAELGVWATRVWFMPKDSASAYWYDFGDGKSMPDTPEVPT